MYERPVRREYDNFYGYDADIDTDQLTSIWRKLFQIKEHRPYETHNLVSYEEEVSLDKRTPVNPMLPS